MKILVVGKKPEKKEEGNKKKCWNCKSLLEYFERDVVFDDHGHYIKCLHCEEKIYLPLN